MGGASRSQKFKIQYKLPSLNEVIRHNRSHYMAGVKYKQEIEEVIGWFIVGAKLQPVTHYPVEINLTYYEPNKRRDLDNIVSSQKFILDALQRFNIIKNDNQKCVSKINIKVSASDTKEYYIEVEIKEK